MRRVLALLGALAVLALLARERWPDGLPARLGGSTGPASWPGYVEAETVLLGPPVAGRLVARPVERGAEVAAGALLLALDPAAAEAAVAAARARLAVAEAELADLSTGRREVELEVIRAQRREALASLSLAEQELARAARLIATDAASRERHDRALAQLDQARARVERIAAEEAAAALGGREAALEAARARVQERAAALSEARARLADLSIHAPVGGRVEATYFEPGEWVAAGQPVLALLPPDAVKLRFFMPEPALARVPPGSRVAYRCDGCPPGRAAEIVFVASRAEHTPPVIYSREARQKLVFLAEARPVGPAPWLRPGLPVEVVPAAGAAP